MARDATEQAEITGDAPTRRRRRSGGNGRKVRPIGEERSAAENRSAAQRQRHQREREAINIEVPRTVPFARMDSTEAAQMWLQAAMDGIVITRDATVRSLLSRTVPDLVEVHRDWLVDLVDTWAIAAQATLRFVESQRGRRQREAA